MSEGTKVSKPEGATGVAFKSEDEVDGVLVGPVWFVVEDELIPAIDSEFSTPDWPMAEWFDKPQAIRMAKHFGLKLSEA